MRPDDVFDQADHIDEASDMYVLDVFGFSLLTRLRRSDPDEDPQREVAVDADDVTTAEQLAKQEMTENGI